MENIIFIIVFIILLILSFNIYFNRSPHYKNQRGAVLKPCGGKLIQKMILEFQGQQYIELDWFLGLHDIHTQYIPINGIVKKIERIPGKYKLATNKIADDVNYKIRTTVTITDEKLLNQKFNDQQTFGTKVPPPHQYICEQVSGALTPSILNFLKEGQVVKQGDKIGKILLGSRCRLLLPTALYDINKITEMIGDKSKPMSLIYID